MKYKKMEMLRISAVSALLMILMFIASGYATTSTSRKTENTSAGDAAKLITDVTAQEDSEFFYVTIVANRPLTYISTKQASPLAVDFYFPDTALGTIRSEYTFENEIVAGIKASELRQKGIASRVEIQLEKDVIHSVSPFGNGIKIAISKPPAVSAVEKKEKDAMDSVSAAGNGNKVPIAELPAVSAVEKNKKEGIYDLSQTIERAIEVHLQIKVSQDEIKAAESAKKSQETHFYPTFSTSYQYTRSNEDVTVPYAGIVSPANEYTFLTSVRQPLFAGFSILNQYEIARLGLDVAKINEKLVRQNVVFEANNIYFSLLKVQKLLAVAEDTVKQIEAQTEVARNFYQVGMTPLNDLLQSQVELANARQNLVIARNNLESAESDFNRFLRRPINAPVRIQDVLMVAPFDKKLDVCLDTAKENRLEIKIADRKIEIAKKELELAEKDYYPTVTLEGSIFSIGTNWNVDGGAGVNDPHGWNVSATAQWNFWEWGRTHHGVKEKQSRLSQAVNEKTDVQENLILEVKKAYLKTVETEKNIATSEKAIEQAKENLRINQERYKEQVATTTDVLDAQTLLSRTMTNYYNALYDFKISKATLLRAMGQEAME